ncbi:hypothetical protein Pcinc_026726 [Petrolisthes cinctipes]|uniref:C2H2-type domain-containing protein n=1 Tax=Petrolisthes cinctipes TaxID=88211 RepID=A0AAE1F5Z0_PETCI|nr:hypothetical protein Pcinc_026726 [Petrolisthes cinctipes]
MRTHSHIRTYKCDLCGHLLKTLDTYRNTKHYTLTRDDTDVRFAARPSTTSRGGEGEGVRAKKSEVERVETEGVVEGEWKQKEWWNRVDTEGVELIGVEAEGVVEGVEWKQREWWKGVDTEGVETEGVVEGEGVETGVVMEGVDTEGLVEGVETAVETEGVELIGVETEGVVEGVEL